jgi:hypothetical protein
MGAAFNPADDDIPPDAFNVCARALINGEYSKCWYWLKIYFSLSREYNSLENTGPKLLTMLEKAMNSLRVWKSSCLNEYAHNVEL